MSSPEPKRRKLDDEQQQQTKATENEKSFHQHDHQNNSLPLPATLWGSILDHLSYDDVKAAIMACRTIRNDSLGHVRMLNIYKPEHLTGRVARRFPNATCVNVLCLVDWRLENTVRGLQWRCHLSDQAALKVVSFLCNFPKLRKAFVGGVRRVDIGLARFYPYDLQRCHSPVDHQGMYRRMVSEFNDAFNPSNGRLPQNLNLLGVFYGGEFNREDVDYLQCIGEADEDEEGGCIVCSNICKYFPFENVKWASTNGWGGLCISSRERYEIMKSRPGGIEFLQTSSCDRLLCHLENFPVVSVDDSTKKRRDFMRRMEKDGALAPNRLISRDNSILQDAKLLIEFGCDVSKLSSNDVRKTLMVRYLGRGVCNLRRNGRVILLKALYMGLCELGLTLDDSDFIVVDNDKEPALQGLELWPF